MDRVLEVIDMLTSDKQVKSIINSVNDNQEKSKNWLIEESNFALAFLKNPSIVVLAGWYGNLANKLYHYSENVTSVDIDPNCKKIGRKLYPHINFVTKDITKSGFRDDMLPHYDVVVCTSCEHIIKKDFDKMFNKIKKGALVILQSNNYKEIKEHVNCFLSYHEFAESLDFDLKYKGKLKLDKFTRFMAVGIK